MSPERRARLATTILVILFGVLAIGVFWELLVAKGGAMSAEH